MTQVHSIPNISDKNINAKEDLDLSQRESVVNTLVEQGLPRAFNPTNYINKIAESYGISVKDARECLKEAVDKLEGAAKDKVQKQDDEKLYAQSGYFYPSQTDKTENAEKEKDGMDSLVAFGSFQKLRFGLY